MAYRRRVSKRKIGKRKRNFRKRSTVLVNRALSPIPQRYITKMKWVEPFSINTNGSTAVGQVRFRMNSIFNPNWPGSPTPTHQPYARDTFATLYNRYRVFKIDYVITAASSNPYAVKVGVLPSNEIYTATTFSEIQEKPRAKFINQGVGAPQQLLKGSVNLASLYGRTKSQMMADDRYQADMDSNPLEAAILNVYGALIGDAAVDNNISGNITLVYHVEMFDPKLLAQS